MSIAQQTPFKGPPQSAPTPSAAPHNGRWSGFRHLLSARMLEMAREREIIFWIFVFPLLLALGLGFAFRNKPADRTTIAIAAGPEAQNTLSLMQNSAAHASIRAEIVDQARAKDGLRLGKFDLVIEPLAPGRVQYDFDPARPESVLSHAEVDPPFATKWARSGRLVRSVAPRCFHA